MLRPTLRYTVALLLPHVLWTRRWRESGTTPATSRFDDLRKVCDHYFGQPRSRGSHLFYRTPWQGEPLVNIQSVRGMAKPYQVRQVINAIDNLEESR